MQEMSKGITTGEISQFQLQKPYHCCVIALGLLEDYLLTFFKGAVDFFCVCACRNRKRTDGVEYKRDLYTPRARSGGFQQSEKD